MTRFKSALGVVLLTLIGLPAIAAVDDTPAPWETCVRITTSNGKTASIGSGTIILSDATRTVVLTAAHVVVDPGEVTVDIFDGQLVGKDPIRPKVTPLYTYKATVIAFDKGADVGLIEFRPGVILASSPIVPEGYQPAVDESMTTVGCSAGEDATPWSTKVVGYSSDPSRGYFGTQCKFRPAQGRSGGGLFTLAWELAGVCNFAEVNTKTGDYASPGSIYKLLDKVTETGINIFSPRRDCPTCPNDVTPSPQRQTPPDQGLIDALRNKRYGQPQTPPASTPAPSAPALAALPAETEFSTQHVVEAACLGVFALIAVGFAFVQATGRKRLF